MDLVVKSVWVPKSVNFEASIRSDKRREYLPKSSNGRTFATTAKKAKAIKELITLPPLTKRISSNDLLFTG